MIGETLNTTGLIKSIRGNVKVELRNATTGKTEDFIESSNFISMAGIRHLKYIQRANFFKDGISALNANADTDNAMPNTHNHIVLTSLTDAPNQSAEWHMHGKLAGYAGKYTYSGTCNLLGSPNAALSEATPTYTKWVFDWQTSAGNGSIGSIGWMNAASTYRGTVSFPGRFYSSCTVQDSKTVSNFYVRLARSSDSQYFLAVSGIPTIIVADSNFAEVSNFTVGAQFKAATTLTGIAWDGGNNKLWVLGINASNAPIIASYSASGSLIDGPTTITNRSYRGLTYDGSHLWSIAGASSNLFTLYKISTNGNDVSNAPVTLPPHEWSGAPGTGVGEWAYGLAYEPTKQLVYVATWAYHYSSSNFRAGGGSGVNSSFSSSSIRAFTTSGEEAMVPASLYAYSISTASSDWLTSLQGTSQSNEFDFDMIGPYQIIIPDRKSTTSSVKRLLLDGMGSRALLPAPLNKTSAQTMRITYQMDYI